MTAVDELIAFLRAQLDDDERTIRGSGTLGWLTFRQPDGTMDHTEAASLNSHTWIVGGRERTGYASADVVSRESERLAEVEAKRRILDDIVRNGYDDALGNASTDALAWRVLGYIALPYADRDGYREEWRPAG